MDGSIEEQTAKCVKLKFRNGETVIALFEAYQIIGAEHQNRLLATVQSGNTHALFSFAISNYPPLNISDLRIQQVFPINETFLIDTTCQSSGISTHQFLIICGKEMVNYYFYPDEITSRAKSNFEATLQKLIQEHDEQKSYNFEWLEYYRREDLLVDIDPNVAGGRVLPKNRESKFREELERRKNEYTVHEPYKIYTATWNVNLNQPTDDLCLKEWLANTEDPPDIYAIGFQEINMSADTIIFSETKPDLGWVTKIMEGLHSGDNYVEVITVRLVGMMLTIAVKKSLCRSISKCSSAMVGTGTLKFGNKGGVAVSLQLNETLLCFVNSHLAAHLSDVEKRNEDHDEILRRMQFSDGFKTRAIEEHHQIYWIGDLNYRIQPIFKDEQVKLFANYEMLGRFDQLYLEREKRKVFVDFKEGKITFQPTYKYDPGTDNWDSSEKSRAPAWCDRILWKGARIEQISYNSVMQIRMSDHKPVYGVFIAYILTKDEQKFKRVHEEALKTVDKYENDNQPQITVVETDIDFGEIKFYEPYSRELVLANNCHLPVKFKFKGKDDNGTEICEDWIKISHKEGSLLTGSTLHLKVDIFIDEKAAPKITRKLKDATSGSKGPLDILVLHVEKGRDIFVTLFGEFKPSVFGFRPETLMKLTKPLIEYDLKELIAIDNDVENVHPFHNNVIVPREMWLLMDYLHKYGITVQNLFTLNRRHRNDPGLAQIRDWLDSWSIEAFPGNPCTAAEMLLKLFQCLPLPLIPILERDLSIHSTNFEKCKELLLTKVPLINRKIFFYIVLFIKELQKNNHANHMDDKLLATVFSQVMCRHRNEQYGQRFLQQFISNDVRSLINREFEKRQ